MAIAFDNSDEDSSNTNNLNYDLTVGSGTNRIIFVSVVVANVGSLIGLTALDINSDGNVTVDYVIHEKSGLYLLHYLTYYIAPPIGSCSIDMSTGGSTPNVGIFSLAWSYFGVKQSSPINNFSQNTSPAFATFTMSVTPSVSECWSTASIETFESAMSANSGCVKRQGGGGYSAFDSNGTITASVPDVFVVEADSGTPQWSGIMCAFESADGVDTGGDYYGQVGYY